MAAIALAVGLRFVDLAWHESGGEPSSWLFGGDGSAARSILSAIATSLAAIVSLLFSLTIVTLQLASTQYSPRLLQTFTRDRVVQVCLTTLLSSFVYSLIVLRNVRSTSDSSDASSADLVPRLSITVAVLLMLASVAALVAFISHQVVELRVETMMREVHAEASRAVDGLQDDEQQDRQRLGDLPEVPRRAVRVRATSSGFLQHLDARRLAAHLAEAEVTLLVEARPGDAVIRDAPVGWAWSDSPTGRVDVDALHEALAGALVVGFERIDAQDPSYGLRKLADIAIRALSPGINDPTTAVHALSHLSALLGETGEVDAWHRCTDDPEGRPRVHHRSWDYPGLLDLALMQIHHYGHTDPAVADRLFGVLTELAWRVRSPLQREAVERHCGVLSDACLADPPTGWSRDDVDDRASRVRDVLAEAG